MDEEGGAAAAAAPTGIDRASRKMKIMRYAAILTDPDTSEKVARKSSDMP
jgi:hypothetical protein